MRWNCSQSLPVEEQERVKFTSQNPPLLSSRQVRGNSCLYKTGDVHKFLLKSILHSKKFHGLKGDWTSLCRRNLLRFTKYISPSSSSANLWNGNRWRIGEWWGEIQIATLLVCIVSSRLVPVVRIRLLEYTPFGLT